MTTQCFLDPIARDLAFFNLVTSLSDTRANRFRFPLTVANVVIMKIMAVRRPGKKF